MRALIVVIVALLSAPAFGDGKLAVDLGFGGLKPTQAERFDPNVPSEKPPLPRAKPRQEGVVGMKQQDDEFERELEEWLDSEEGAAAQNRILEQLRRDRREQREMARPRRGVEI